MSLRSASGAPRPVAPSPPTGAPTLGQLLEKVHDLLAVGADPADARREAARLVADVLDLPMPAVRGSSVAPVPAGAAAACLCAAERRARGVPLAYATGRAAFRRLDLTVDARVLIPRPETEVLVDEVLALGIAAGATAVDVGTGSGAIALALASEGSFGRVIATDVSADALRVARINLDATAAALHTPVELRQGALLAPLRGERVELIVSNPPYIAFHEAASLPASVREYEPAVALFGGLDGVEVTAALVRQTPDVLVAGGWLALEADATRAGAVATLLTQQGGFRDIRIRRDLAGRERIVLAQYAG